MIIITPDNVINKSANNISKTKSIFLAGTIDNGNSIDWQKEIINKLSKLDLSLEIYSPRRANWDLNPTKEDMEKQIKWEQKHLDKADLICMVFTDNSKSPITLLEMGLYATSGKLIVFCTDNFWRYDNVRLTCEKYKIPLFNSNDIDIIIKKIVSHI